MTKLAAHPLSSLLKRLARVAAVALCTASSVVLLGAVPVSYSGKTTPKAVKPVAAAPVRLATVTRTAPVVAPVTVVAAPAPAPVVEPAPTAPTTRVIQMEVTAYCPCTKCCGPNARGITASGKDVSYNGGKFVAADTKVLPFGKKLVIPGYADDQPVEVIDRGGAIKGNKLDLYFPTHAEALVWGRQTLDVTVYE